MCQDCIRSLLEAPSTLCITWDTVCVCVCLPLYAPRTPTAPSRCSEPINLISAGPSLHVSILCRILARGSIHPVYHGDTVCVSVCVCVCPCLHPPLPNASSRCSLPIILIGGAARLHVSRLLPIIARGSIHPVYHGGHCVWVCVCVCVCECVTLPAPTTPTAS